MSESENLTFEKALEQLEAVVRELESMETGLDKSLERYEDGVRLLKRCRSILDEAERKIRLLTRLDANGNPVTEAFDVATAIDRGPENHSEPALPTKRNTGRTVRGTDVEPPDRGERLF